MVSSPMALPFAYFFCFISFFPYFNLSCPDSSVCDDVESPPYPDTALNLLSPNTPPISCTGQSCGDVAIYYPFFLNTSSPCGGKYGIRCDRHDPKEPKPMINFDGREYVVEEIAHSEKVVVLQDIQLGNYLREGHCGFLYNFTDTIHNFSLPTGVPPLGSSNLSTDCESEIDTFSTFLFSKLSDHHCDDYNIYYWGERMDRPKVAASCLAAEPSLFEWVLSFGGDDDTLSLKSAGFSQQFELREDCFDCQVTGKSCGSNNIGGCSCANICEPQEKGKRPSATSIEVGSSVGATFFLVCLAVALYLYKNRKVSNNKNIEVFLEEYGALAPIRYSYSNLKKVTKGFQEKLGQGGYGTVFKGTLSNGHLVAVKILKDTQSDGEEFINEVASIRRTSHVNVVSLLGFCCEGSKRALIYDFMCNGSLEKLIYSEKPKTTLEWENLHQIVIGIARGLEYLHRGCNTRIVHFDIKPHNILLDQDFCPKISDFGLAKLCQKKDSIISIAGARGTIGYMAPEVFSRNFGVVSSKSDVYSYGMMVLEIAGGKKIANAGDNNDSSEEYFPHWIYERLNKNGNLLAYGVTAESEETVRKMTLVGLWCIQTMPQNRPPMSRVIEMLEGSVNALQVPPQPYLSSSPFGSLTITSPMQDICSDDCSSLIH